MSSAPIEPSQLSPLRHLDAAAVSKAARKETRNREVHLPAVSTFRWWARRTESVNGAIIDAFQVDREGRLLVADPFAGGGVIPLAAAIRGHQVYAQDLNPWAAQGVAAMMAIPAPDDLRKGRRALFEHLEPFLRQAYSTSDGSDRSEKWTSHTFRVAAANCPKCSQRIRLFPYAMVSLVERKERGSTDGYLACKRGHLMRGHSDREMDCPECRVRVNPGAKYTRRRWIDCPECGEAAKLAALGQSGSWGWEPVLVERSGGGERSLELASQADVDLAESPSWNPKRRLGEIPAGRETSVLLRHGFNRWEDLYPRRQRVVLERLLEAIDDVLVGPTRDAMRIAAVGTTEMAGLLSRWDRWYLKSYEGMANHRFNFTTFTAEPNVWGRQESGRGTFIRRIDQLIKASDWLENETKTQRHFRVEGPIPSAARRTPINDKMDVRVVEGSSERMVLPRGSADLVLTDPPYHDDVQYGELSLPFRAWAKQSVDRLPSEAVAKDSGDNGNAHSYRELLARIFSEARKALKPDGHFVFSYANRDPNAWSDVLWALQEAGLQAAGFQILHSENETDLAKRGVRACTLDLIMDLVPAGAVVFPWAPATGEESAERAFLRVVAEFFMRVGSLREDWEKDLSERLRIMSFLRSTMYVDE